MTIIDGPEEVFNSKEVNKPIVTDKMPINIAMNTICFGIVSDISRCRCRYY